MLGVAEFMRGGPCGPREMGERHSRRALPPTTPGTVPRSRVGAARGAGASDVHTWLPSLVTLISRHGCPPGLSLSSRVILTRRSLDASDSKTLAQSAFPHGRVIHLISINTFSIINVIIRHWSESKTDELKRTSQTQQQQRNKNELIGPCPKYFSVNKRFKKLLL